MSVPGTKISTGEGMEAFGGKIRRVVAGDEAGELAGL